MKRTIRNVMLGSVLLSNFIIWSTVHGAPFVCEEPDETQYRCPTELPPETLPMIDGVTKVTVSKYPNFDLLSFTALISPVPWVHTPCQSDFTIRVYAIDKDNVPVQISEETIPFNPKSTCVDNKKWKVGRVTPEGTKVEFDIRWSSTYITVYGVIQKTEFAFDFQPDLLPAREDRVPRILSDEGKAYAYELTVNPAGTTVGGDTFGWTTRGDLLPPDREPVQWVKRKFCPELSVTGNKVKNAKQRCNR